jgi:GAF domain-containing protein
MNDDQQTTASLTAEHFLALIRVGTALHAELDESRLLHLIVQTACDLTGAAFAAFSLRPVNGEGQPLGPSEGRFFRLAAVVGVTAEQENLFRHMSLGGEGLLAPIFRQGVPVLVSDAVAHLVERQAEEDSTQAQISAREAAAAYAQ